MSNARTLGIIVLALVLVAAAWFVSQIGEDGLFFPTPTPEFEESYSELSLTWQQNGVPRAHLHDAFEELLALTPQKRALLKEALAQHAQHAQEETQTARIAEAYLHLVEAADQEAAMQVASLGLFESRDPCPEIPRYKIVYAHAEKTQQALALYLEKISAFVEENPKEAQSIGLYGHGAGVESLSLKLEAEQETIAFLEESCRLAVQ